MPLPPWLATLPHRAIRAAESQERNMKNISLIAAAALLAAGAVNAQVNKPVTGGVYGELGFSGLNADIDTSRRRESLNGLGWRGVLGWNAHPNLAVEAMLGRFGRRAEVVDIDTRVELTHAVGAYIKPKYQFNDRFEVFARVGYGDVNLKAVSRRAGRVPHVSGGFTWGVGVTYNFTPNFYSSTDYTSHYDKGDVSVSSTTLSFGYRF